MKQRRRLLALLLASTIAMGSFTGALALTDEDVKDSTAAQSNVAEDATEMDRQILFNDDWKFYLGDASGAQEKNFNDSSWRDVTLPHDWSIELDFTNGATTSEIGHLAGGIGWYRKTFTLPPEMADKRITVDFGGVYMDSYTYVNGELVSRHPYGYTPFSYDITDLVVCDGETENVIAVRAENRIDSMQGTTSRWYSGSGIYRDVHLTVTEPVHVARYGTKITTPDLQEEYTSGQDVTVNVATQVQNDSEDEATVTVRTSMVGYEDESVLIDPVESEPVAVAAGETETVEQVLSAVEPALWSVDDPNLYNLVTEILVDGVVTDRYESRFGFRWTEFTVNDGFLLNGEWMKLNGMCMHHDQGALGSVSNYRAVQRQMEILKGMGVNAIRVTHNPASNELLQVCDELGLMVIEEAFDSWFLGKKSYDYGVRFFEMEATDPTATPGQTWAEFDLKTMVNRGKNFPSIIMWSLGNEIYATDNARGPETAQKLYDWAKEIDDTRPCTMGEDKFRERSATDTTSTYIQVADKMDVVGMNYIDRYPYKYDTLRATHPDWIIYGSENSSATKSRGVYAHPDSEGTGDSGSHPDYQQSSYDNDHVGWGSTATQSWTANRDRKFVLGEFVWTGFDYIGEPTPWNQNAYAPPKNSYFGVVDTAGFVKDDYYLYESQWTSVEENPMVHIMPHWNWDDASLRAQVTVNGQIPVRIYSNARSVELFKDGESLGKQTFATITPYQDEKGEDVVYQVNPDNASKLYLEWRIPYEPGTLKAVAYDENDEIVAEDVVTTAGDPAAISLSADRQVIESDGRDLSYITVDVLDADGNFVPTADNQMYFNITGDGKIVGVDNGNSPSWERYKDYDGVWKRKAFSGKALVIVQSTKENGSFTLTATGDGLASDSITCYTTENAGEGKDILGYDNPGTVVTNVNERPDLPETVMAIYSDGSKEEVPVVWDEIPEEQLAQPGTITVRGDVDGATVEITVIVKSVLGVRDTRMVTRTGTVPTLPETVKVVYSDGTEQSMAVAWETITEEEVAQEGTITKLGTVEGIPEDMKATAYIRVGEQSVPGANVAVRAAGETYPKANASYNVGTGHNMSDSINDGTIAFSPSWNNWQNGGVGLEDSWVSVEFEEAYTISKVGVHFFTDGQTKEPRELIVQYSNDGADWTNVENQSKTSGFNVAQGDVNTEYSITFDAVNAKFIRLSMKGQVRDASTFKPVGISELKVYSDITTAPVPSSDATLTALQLNGEDLEGFAPTTYSYTYVLGYNDSIPEITAVPAANASAFVVPPLTNDGSASIIVSAEDGTTNRYTIQFQRSDATLESVVLSADKTDLVENELVPFTLTATMEDGTTLSSGSYTVEYTVTATDAEQKGWVKFNNNGQIEAHTAGAVEAVAEVTYRGKTVASEPLALTIAAATEPIVVQFYDAVSVTTKLNTAPVLPEKVTAYVANSFARELSVQWDAIDPSQYAAYGQFTVEGTVEGQELKPTATVLVKDAIAAQQVSAATPYGNTPSLPEIVTVYNSDGTTNTEVPVTWEPMSADDFKVEEGTVVLVNGVAELDGTELPVIASVRVTSQDVVVSKNYAELQNGYELPFAIASYTNDVPESTDRVDKLNDGKISFATSDAEGKNIWCDWQRNAGGTENWVAVIIGNSGAVVNRFVDTLKVGFYDEGSSGGTQKPSDYRVEYYTGPIDFTLPDGPTTALGPNNPRGHVRDMADSPLNDDSNWQEVSYVGGKPAVKTGEMMEITFDPVETCMLRVYMTPTGTACLGVTELQYFGKDAVAKSDFAVNAIKIDGEPLADFDASKMEYTVELTSAAVPAVTAEATNNASVTIVPAVSANGTAKVIIAPEDGSVANTKTYTIQFHSESTADTYPVVTEPVEGATVTTDLQQAQEGQTVTVNIADIAADKQFHSITVVDADNNPVDTTEVVAGEQYTFTMPASAVTVKVVLEDNDPNQEHLLTVSYSGKDVSLWVDGVQQSFADKINQYRVNLKKGEIIALTFKPRNEGREFRAILCNDVAQEVTNTTEYLYTGTMDGMDQALSFTFDIVYKELLKQTIDAAQQEVDAGNTQGLIPAVQEAFDTRFQRAKEVYADQEATQAQIDAAHMDLMMVLHFLDFKSGDKTYLKDLIDTAEALDLDLFVEAGKAELEAALANAKGVYADESALQPEVDEAAETLLEAMLALDRKADLSVLNTVIAKAEEILLVLDEDYIPDEEANEAFKRSLATAKSLTEESGQRAVDEAAVDLSNKMAALRLKADKSLLEELLKEMQDVDPSDYTAESYTPFAAVIKRAEIMYNNPMLSVDDEPEIQSTVNEARALFAKLVQKNSGSSSGGSHSGSSNKPSGSGTTVAVTSPVITAAQNVQTQIYVVSDTTLPFAIKRGSAYCFKMTVVGSTTAVPSFTVGNGDVLKTQYVAKVGNDYYFRVWAIGTPGSSTGVYTTLPGQNPQLHCVVTVK